MYRDPVGLVGAAGLVGGAAAVAGRLLFSLSSLLLPAPAVGYCGPLGEARGFLQPLPQED